MGPRSLRHGSAIAPGDTAAASREAVGIAPCPAYVDWTYSLVRWSTGLPYDAAEIFFNVAGSWQRLTTRLAVPAELNGVAELCSWMVLYHSDIVLWSPQSVGDGVDGRLWGGGLPPHVDEPAVGTDAGPRESMSGTSGHAAAGLAPRLGVGLVLAPPLPLPLPPVSEVAVFRAPPALASGGGGGGDWWRLLRRWRRC